MGDTSAGRLDRPGRYEIRIKGHLAARWATWFAPMTLTVESDGTTVIEGAVMDQSALHGLLHKVRDIGLPLLSVIRLDTDVTQLDTGRPARPSSNPDNSPSGD